MKLLLLIFFILLNISNIYSKEVLGFVSVTTGVNIINFDNINLELQKNGIEPINTSNYGYLGVGTNGLLFSRLYIGIYYNYVFGENIDNENVIISTSGSNNGIELGFNIFKNNNILLIPIVGLSGNSIKMNIYDKTVPYKDLSDVIKNPKKEISMELNSFDIKSGFEIVYNFEKRDKFILGIGARGGILYSVGERNWELSNLGEIVDAPLPEKMKLFFGLSFLIGNGYLIND